MKSVELTHGEINFRQHPPAIGVSKAGKWTLARVISAIRERFTDADAYIRTKEELNKETLLGVDEPNLKTVGLEIVRKETFGYKLKGEELAEQLKSRPELRKAAQPHGLQSPGSA